jgi:nucleoside-diphosphate-sugar epimerase
VPQSSRSVFPIRSRVLIVGGAGYIGSVLARRLLDDGYQVRVFDALFYGAGSLAGLEKQPWFDLVVGDTRDRRAVDEALANVDAVVHLGELVGDPACAVDPALTHEINVAATRYLLRRARELGVRRFVYPSSCSVYGANDEIVDEQSMPNPVSIYAESKVYAEEAVAQVAGDGMETVTLRLATVYGLSPRPRFDLVVNLFAARGVVDRRIVVHGGDQWRPFVHVADAADAIVAAIEAEGSVVNGQVFNVGADTQNRTIGEVAEMVRLRVPDAELQIAAIDDHRNYRVSFERIHAALGFQPSRTLDDGIAEIQAAIDALRIRDYRDARYSNVRTVRGGLPVVPARPAAFRVGGPAAVSDPEAQLAG